MRTGPALGLFQDVPEAEGFNDHPFPPPPDS